MSGVPKKWRNFSTATQEHLEHLICERNGYDGIKEQSDFQADGFR